MTRLLLAALFAAAAVLIVVEFAHGRGARRRA